MSEQRKWKKVFLCFFFSSACMAARLDWNLVRQAEWNCDFHSIRFLPDGLHGWAVGSGGTIIHSTDGGVTWLAQANSISSTLYGVAFLNRLDGWAAGDGCVLRTADGGVTWIVQAVPSYDFRSIFFTSPLNGFVIGTGQSFATTDGGAGWMPLFPAGADYYLLSAFFAGPESGWAAGREIIHTTDGGVSWTAQKKTMITFGRSLCFTDTANGWLVGYDVSRTTSGGRTWDTFPIDNQYAEFNDVCFADARTGWIIGPLGAVFHTSDGGSNWRKQDSGTKNGLNRVFFTGPALGWIAGDDNTLIRTTDGGRNWLQATVPSNTVYAVDFIDSLHGWAAGSKGMLLRTENGGKTWSNLDSRSNSDLFGLDCLDSNRVIAVGDNASVLRTSDGGDTWDTGRNWWSFWYHHVFFIDPTDGWAVGWYESQDYTWSRGTLIHTSDGGNTWGLQTSGTGNPLEQVFFADSLNGWAVGSGGTVIHTTDRGLTWAGQTSPAGENLWCVHFSGTQSGWAVGENGTIIRTTDQGATWLLQHGGTRENLMNVHFTGPDEGWAVGGSGTILHTIDGGVSWKKQTARTGGMLLDVFFLDRRNGWIAGEHGVMLRYGFQENAAVAAPDPLPVPDRLSPCFPNPFNLSTRMDFWMSAPGKMEAAVYGIDGKRVRILEDGFREAGRFETVWDGTDALRRPVASGLYIAVFRTGRGVQKQKLTLLK